MVRVDGEPASAQPNSREALPALHGGAGQTVRVDGAPASSQPNSREALPASNGGAGQMVRGAQPNSSEARPALSGGTGQTVGVAQPLLMKDDASPARSEQTVAQSEDYQVTL